MKFLRLGGAQLAVGAAAIFARFAIGGTGPLGAAALRLGIAALIVVGFAAVRHGWRPRAARTEVAFAIAGLALAVHFASWISSLLYTSVAVSTLLVTTTPIWTGLYETIVQRQPATGRYWIGLVCALAGIWLVGGAHSAAAPVAGHVAFGNLLAIIGAVAIGAYFMIVRAVGARPRSSDPIPTLEIVARTYSWAALALAIAALATHQGAPGNNLAAWGGIVGMALISQLLGHTALNAALRDFTPSIVAISTLLEPVFAALLAAAIFHESLTP
ncbi:MAG: DMT family transporter, partial [Vulcanimicrobiaceae bacterium]